MGNARADEFGRAIPSEGGGYDLIVLGLQEATWSTKKKQIDPTITIGSKEILLLFRVNASLIYVNIFILFLMANEMEVSICIEIVY